MYDRDVGPQEYYKACESGSKSTNITNFARENIVIITLLLKKISPSSGIFAKIIKYAPSPLTLRVKSQNVLIDLNFLINNC